MTLGGRKAKLGLGVRSGWNASLGGIDMEIIVEIMGSGEISGRDSIQKKRWS